MNEILIYKYLEFLIFAIYFIMIFLSIQIWLIWQNIDKNEFRSRVFITDPFIKNNIIVVFLMSFFFIMHEFFEETKLSNSYLVFEFSELMGFILILYITYMWYSILKTCVIKQPINEILLNARMNHQKLEETFWTNDNKSKFILIFGFFFTTLGIALFVPISSIIFSLIIGVLFVPPAVVLVSTLIGASLVSRELNLT
ncbi:MAG: hypothetical protein C3F06_00440 [Candidatus Methanoperedenaceae archaeon]|nr:MAG: hypothetical protein C3F06_00440 [Candidatus Methanoperedenaceae archaeon]